MSEQPVTEIAFFHCIAGRQDEFGPVITSAVQRWIAPAPGCRSIEVRQGVETPTTFVVTVEWDSLAAHEAFRDSEALAGWSAEVGPFFGADASAEHYVHLA